MSEAPCQSCHWKVERDMIVRELERLARAVETVASKIDDTRHEIASKIERRNGIMSKLGNEVTALNVKAGIWGMLGGVLMAGLALLIHFVSSRGPS